MGDKKQIISAGGAGLGFQTASTMYFAAGGTNSLLTLSPTTQTALLTAYGAAIKGLVIKGAASQTANLQEWQNSAGTALTVVDASGNVGIGDTTPDAPLDVVGDVYISDGLSLFETAVSDGTVEATTFCTGDGETNCTSDFGALASSGSGWVDDGTEVRLNTSTDEVEIGSAGVLAAKLAINGDADEIQFLVQGNATQTSSLAVFEQSDGTDVLTISNGGALTLEGTVSDIGGNLVLDDTVDIGSATTGINVTTAGVITDSDGNVVIGDTVDLGSATTGLRVATT